MTSKRDLEERIEMLSTHGMWAMIRGNPDRFYDLQRECLALKQEIERRFPPPPAGETAAEKRREAPEARITAWLQKRVENHPGGKPYTGLAADWAEAKQELGHISRDRFSALRNKVVPTEWRPVGRRPAPARPEQQQPKKTREAYSRK